MVSVLSLLAAVTALPGCMVAVGSKIETDQTGRMDKLERRIQNAEKELGLTPPPLPPLQSEQVQE